MDRNPGAQPQPKAGAQSFLRWFPWEKTLIWGLFLLAVYVLRDFFFIIFMTFMISYIMGNVLRNGMKVLSPHKERAWVQRTVAVFAFLLLLGVFYGVGTYLYQPLKKQAEGLVDVANSVRVNWESYLDRVLARTVGAWQFEMKYRGKEGEELRKQELEEFRARDFSEQTWDDFRRGTVEIEKLFHDGEHELINSEVDERFRALKEQNKDRAAIESWMSENIDEKKFKESREDLLREWEANNRAAVLYVQMQKKLPSGSRPPPFDEFIQSKEFLLEQEEELKRGYIARELKEDKEERYVADFKVHLVKEVSDALKGDEKYRERFRAFYKRLQETQPLGPHKCDYDRFLLLSAAKSKEEFEERMFGNEKPEDREKRVQKTFRDTKEQDLLKVLRADWKWLQGPQIQEWLKGNIPDFTRWTYNFTFNFTAKLFQVLVGFILSLLLSFFITFDLPRLTRGIRTLENSRIRDFYLEIAPSLISFGRLIGRAFLAQGVIAIFNTILTYLAVWALGIQNEIFLCSIVFICSFIPVLGVVLSSAPIAVMALIQPEGTIWLALQAIGAILIIHFIETSILNPKILGEMLHLHPVLVLGILAVGEHFFGVWGLLLGVPVAVYIIRHVILGEDVHLTPATAAAVVKVTGIHGLSPGIPPAAPGSASGRDSAPERTEAVAAGSEKRPH